MGIEYKKVSDFKSGIVLNLLTDAYSFNSDIERECKSQWEEKDCFWFDHLQIADKCCFITTLNGEAIGFASWDPRNLPEYAEIGDNCIATKYKGNGYGKLQLQEAIKRIIQNDVNRIIVTTSDCLIPAQRMYESVGFLIDKKREKKNVWDINYVLSL